MTTGNPALAVVLSAIVELEHAASEHEATANRLEGEGNEVDASEFRRAAIGLREVVRWMNQALKDAS